MQDVAIRSIISEENSLLCLLSRIVALGYVIADHLLHAIFEALD